MVITLGESLMDMVSQGDIYRAVPGGSPYNMSLAMARLGGDTTQGVPYRLFNCLHGFNS